MPDKFDQWLCDTIPDVPEPELRREIHLAILKERIREKSRRRRHWKKIPYGVLAATVLFLLSDWTSVGGDSFDVVEIKTPLAEGRVFMNEFSRNAIGGSGVETEAGAVELIQLSAAGEGRIVKARGFKIGDGEAWSVVREYMVRGKTMRMAATAEGAPANVTRELVEFTTGPWEELRPGVESGAIRPQGSQTVTLDGVVFEGHYWVFDLPEFGRVVHFAGFPVR